MIRLLFWILVLGGAWLVLSGTLPVPGVPDEEVVYATTPPVVSCILATTGCTVVYTLEVANVGRSVQESVKVRVRTSVLENPAVAPTLRRASETAPLQSAGEKAGVDAYPIGPLAPEERVAVVFALHAPTREAVLGWERVLVGVDPDTGAAEPGDPGAITSSRLMHVTGRLLDRVAHELRGAYDRIASSSHHS
jgi:hypothetical protein